MNPSSSSMALISSSSSSSSASSSSSKRKRDPNSYGDESDCKRPKNDVFMNYSSKDIGKSFISHLLASLRVNGFTISDYCNLRVGHDARFQVFKAIEESEISLVVFSPNYASSKECLDELVHIRDCVARYPDQIKVLPVFYNVEPSDVRNQEGHDFKEPFEAHKTSTDRETVKNWKQALKDVGKLAGRALKDFRNEAELVLEIVNQIGKMLSPQDIHVTDHPVGIRSRSEELISKLRLYCEDVLVIGVFGISGIGKTTIVKAMYNKIASEFQVSCFLEDIHRRYNGRGDWKLKLQKDLLSQLNKDDKVAFCQSFDGVIKIQNLLRCKKTLLVLDDVQKLEHLEGFGINSLRFFKGSRIIVTTRDVDSLGGIPHTSYHTRLLNKQESRKLFIRLMFARDEPVHAEFVKEVVAHAGGLPLVLKVWSRHFTQYKEHLPAALKTLKQIPHGDVQKQLQMSYDSLSPQAKNLFLDIACCFDGMEMISVLGVFDDEDFRADYEIEKLAHKFLVENKGDFVSLPYVVKKMAHEVVRQENPDEPGQRTRLMGHRDVVRVLRDHSGTDSVRSIKLLSLDQMEEEATLHIEAFRKMSGLRFIRLAHRNLHWSCSSNDDMSACFSFKHLKFLYWNEFPCKSLDNFDMGNVVFIFLENSKLEKLWEGVKSFKKLKILDVGCSASLTKTGNFIGLENLEQLRLRECENLEELDNSIGCLQKLVTLDLGGCKRLKRLPWEMIGKLTFLQNLFLENCSSLLEISHEIGSLISLTDFNIDYNIFSSLPSLCQLHQLTTIGFSDCTNLKSIPDVPLSIKRLYVTACINLVNLPSNCYELQFLTKLQLDNCSKLGSKGFKQVTQLRNLQKLYMRNCNVSQVSNQIGNLVSLRILYLSGNTFSSLPESFNNLSQLKSLLINNCYELELLPPLPPQLKDIEATECWSLDMLQFDSMQNAYIFHSKVFEESLMSIEGLVITLSGEEVPEWCTYGNSGNVLSFVAPIHFHSKICGLVLCATRDEDCRKCVCPTIYNRTKGTSHWLRALRFDSASKIVMFFPLNDTTLVVEAGDTLEVGFGAQGRLKSGGVRLVYEDDVVDSGLVLKDVRDQPKLSLFPLSLEIMTGNNITELIDEEVFPFPIRDDEYLSYNISPWCLDLE